MGGGATDIVSGFVGLLSSVTISEELCRQRGAGWKRGTGERVEVVGLLVKEQFKVRGMEIFMGLVMD
jgi:hypothetical protein